MKQLRFHITILLPSPGLNHPTFFFFFHPSNLKSSWSFNTGIKQNKITLGRQEAGCGRLIEVAVE